MLLLGSATSRRSTAAMRVAVEGSDLLSNFGRNFPVSCMRSGASVCVQCAYVADSASNGHSSERQSFRLYIDRTSAAGSRAEDSQGGPRPGRAGLVHRTGRAQPKNGAMHLQLYQFSASCAINPYCCCDHWAVNFTASYFTSLVVNCTTWVKEQVLSQKSTWVEVAKNKTTWVNAINGL